MESKISVKTILLFTALFILGTMILGFYSCSGNTTPVSPQLTDEFTDDGLVPADGVTTIDNGDGTYTIVDANGDTTTITTPGTTYTTEDGTTIITFTATLDEDGNMIIVDTREGAGGSDEFEVDNPVSLEFSSFVADGDQWTGNIMVTNLSHVNSLCFPCVVFGYYGEPEMISNEDPVLSEFNLANFLDPLVNPDIYFGLYRDSRIPKRAYPTIFIADEDEDYTVAPDETAEHEITVRFDPEAPQFFEVNLVYQLVPDTVEPEGLWGDLGLEMPLGIDIEFVEYLDGVSRIAVTVDMDPAYEPAKIQALVEESLYGGFSLFVFSELNEFGQPVYTGKIQWNPDEDGPINIMAYFPQIPSVGVIGDSFMDFTTLTPE